MNKIFEITFLILTLTKLVKTKVCPKKADECEYCDMGTNNMVILNCNSNNKSMNYNQLFNSIQSLVYNKYDLVSITYKIIPILPSNIFYGKDIVTLILTYNEINYILNNTFSGIKSFEKLDLSNNKLKSIDNLIISFTSNIYLTKYGQFVSLKTIDLSYNLIYGINIPFSSAFEGLKALNMSLNKVNYICLDAFKYMKNLTELNINKNMPDLSNSSLFTELKNLENLKLEESFLTDLDSFPIELNKVKNLYLRQTRISNLKSLVSKMVNLEYLDASYNQIFAIYNSTFQSIQTKTIILKKNHLVFIEPGSFDNLINLILLDLSACQFKSISFGLFNKLNKLQTLSLGANQLNQMDDYLFSNLTSLTKLSLSSNQLVYITENLFFGLFNLTELRLEDNFINHIEYNAFKDLNKLKTLNLSYNNIINIYNHTFKGLTKLETLILNYNIIETVDKYMFAPLESLKSLSLDSNIISRLDQDVFVYVKNITELYLGNNLLDMSTNFFYYLSNLDLFHIQTSRIKKLDSNHFNNLKKITKLNLKSNQISTIEGVFQGKNFSDKITELDLSSNLLTKLKNDDFGKKFKLLTKLSLNDNKIVSIDKETFRHTKVLDTLNLSQNYLIDIKNYLFANLSGLRTLDLSKNSISNIYRETFTGLTGLFNFYLNNNYITELNDYVFYELRQILILVLSNNKIELISNQTFKCNKNSSPNIDTIFLDSNRIKSLSFLKGCINNVKKLYLSNNMIEAIERNSFEFVNKLTYLDLSYNKITSIEQYAFKYSNLETLILRNISSSDRIKFKFDFVDNFTTNLIQLDLSYNKIELQQGSNNNETFLLNSLVMESCSINDNNNMPLRLFNNLETFLLSDNSMKFDRNKSIISSLDELKYLTLSKIELDSISSLGLKLERENMLKLANLSHNNIRIIESDHFKNWKYLLTLDLSYNKIEVIEENAFLGIKSLKFVNMAFNRIKYFRPDEFDVSYNIISFKMNNNQIVNFSRLAQNYFQWNEELIFSNNLIDEFNCNEYFYKENSIKRLHLDHNKITTITNTTFYLLSSKLQELLINSNNITFVQPKSFNDFQNLKILRLDDNRIQELDDNLFSDLYRLESLNLSSNYLKFISSNIFSRLFNLIDLDLSNNQLFKIDPFSFQLQHNLKNLYLHVNRNLFINSTSLVGLVSIENVYVSFEVLLNETNKFNLINSLNLTVCDVILNKKYYKSLNIIGTSDGQREAVVNSTQCDTILYFLKYSYFLNLKTDLDVANFLIACEVINRNFYSFNNTNF